MIQDLLPLYLDGVCSEESKNAVESHLQECSVCKDFFSTMRDSDNMDMANINADCENRKIASFKSVRKKMRRNQIFAAAAAVVILISAVLLSVCILKNTTDVISYENNISVSMTDGTLVGRLRGSRESGVQIKRVTCMINGQEKNYLFFCVSATKWDTLVTGSDVFSEFVLCPADRGAEQIDGVCYFTGDYTGIENLGGEDIQEIITASKVLWQR